MRFGLPQLEGHGLAPPSRRRHEHLVAHMPKVRDRRAPEGPRDQRPTRTKGKKEKKRKEKKRKEKKRKKEVAAYLSIGAEQGTAEVQESREGNVEACAYPKLPKNLK